MSSTQFVSQRGAHILSLAGLLCICTVTPPLHFSDAFADDGGSGQEGHGGDSHAAEFVLEANRIYGELITLPNLSSFGIRIESFLAAVQATHVSSVDGMLFLGGEQVDAENFPVQMKIILSRPAWANMSKEGKRILVLHEYLSIMGLDDSNYRLTGPLLAGGQNPIPPSSSSRDPLGLFEQVNFGKLINSALQGRPAIQPWVSFWWPLSAGGISTTRYSSSTGSPAMKYDRARNGETQADDWEIKHHGASFPHLEGWMGHSVGWAGASVLYPEPRQSRVINGVNFTVGDQKALLSEAAMEIEADSFGVQFLPDRNPGKWQRQNEERLSADQFFLALTNFMGLRSC